MSKQLAKQQCSFPNGRPKSFQSKKVNKSATVEQQIRAKAHGNQKSKVPDARALVKQLHATFNKCVARAAVSTSAAQPVAGGWLSVSKPDVKTPAEDPYADFKAQALALRSALASMYGNKPVMFRLPFSRTFSTTVTSGVVNTPAPIDVSAFSEWASLAALFDEYRVRRGRYEFYCVHPTQAVALTASSLTGDSLLTVAYDPSDATAAASSNELTQLEYHKQVFPRMSSTSTGGTYVGLFGKVNNEPYVLHWSYLDSAAITGNGGVVAPGAWKATAGNVNTFPDGTIKPYFLSAETSVKVSIIGTMFLDIEFRNRT